MKLRAVLAARAPAAIRGAPGAMVTKALMVAMLAVSSPELRMCLPGRMVGLEDTLPASLRKATMEPVKVMPPAYVSRCVYQGYRKDLPMRTPR
jgi:hypothetical protein